MQSKEFVFYHKTPIQIRFNDIDIMAHVNNSVYQNYFDLARTQYFNKVFNENINWKVRALVLAKITIEYLNPIFLEENIVVLSKVFKLGNKSLHMHQKIVNDDTKEVKSTNEAILVSFGVKEDGAIEMPDDWRSKIITCEKDIEF
ncbi:MAG: acyl-CoA thioester hydrolase [Marinilabiliales bacterium]|nr:MAG: acyl-CoA thioester hydrolase [Marinilabiliales bacterium]